MLVRAEVHGKHLGLYISRNISNPRDKGCADTSINNGNHGRLIGTDLYYDTRKDPIGISSKDRSGANTHSWNIHFVEKELQEPLLHAWRGERG